MIWKWVIDLVMYTSAGSIDLNNEDTVLVIRRGIRVFFLPGLPETQQA